MKNVDDFRNKGIDIINEDSLPGPKTVVVIGVARGGTSMIAGSLSKLGVFMGSQKNNIVHEDTEISDLIEKKDTTKLKMLIDNRNQQYDMWGWKRPLTIKYLSSIEDLLRNPHYIVIFRDIFSIALRNKLSMSSNSLLGYIEKAHKEYSDLIQFISWTKKPCLLISYEKALINKRLFIDGLVEFIGLKCEQKEISMALSFIEQGRPDYLMGTQIITGFQGHVDKIKNGFLFGWARNKKSRNPIHVELLVDDKVVMTTRADILRKDLAMKNVGNGHHGFKFNVSRFVNSGQSHTLRVLFKQNGEELIGSPMKI